MNYAFLSSVAFMNGSQVESSAAIIVCQDTNLAKVKQQMLALVQPEHNIVDIQVGELQDEVLIALANIAKEKGLV